MNSRENVGTVKTFLWLLLAHDELNEKFRDSPNIFWEFVSDTSRQIFNRCDAGASAICTIPGRSEESDGAALPLPQECLKNKKPSVCQKGDDP